MRNFKYKGLDGLIDINTLSPNKKYYYRITTPYSINMSNFASKIAFYDSDGVLLYHRNDCLAHWLENWVTITYVIWSSNGNLAYFFEFKRDEIFDIVFLYFKERKSYRLNLLKPKEEALYNTLDVRKHNFSELNVINKLKESITPSDFYKDKIVKPKLVDLIFRPKHFIWHP